MGTKDNEQECIANAALVSLQKDSSRTLVISRTGSEKEWYSSYVDRLQGEWDRVAELMMIRFGESGHPVFRATSPLSRGTLRSKGDVKLSIRFCPDGDTVETVFRSIVSVHQLSIHGAVPDVCDEYSACQARPVLTGQRDLLWELARLLVTTLTPRRVPAQENLFQKYKERVERFSHQD